jgi:hypothetical protein
VDVTPVRAPYSHFRDSVDVLTRPDTAAAAWAEFDRRAAAGG